MSSGVQVKVIGLENLKKNIYRKADKMANGVQIAIRTGAYMIHKSAQESLSAEGKTGVIYEEYKPRRTHQASAPGEAPASDTGELRNGLVVVLDDDGMGASVISQAPYSKVLEFGSKSDRKGYPFIHARPFMGPAFMKNKRRISAMIRVAIDTILLNGKHP